MKTFKHKIFTSLLGVLLAFVALNAIGGGIYGLLGAKDIPLAWLEGSPFDDYLIPSIFLLLVVGGSCTVGAVSIIRGGRHSWLISIFCGMLMLLWITVQVLIIGYVSWMQPAIFVAGIFTLILGILIKKAS